MSVVEGKVWGSTKPLLQTPAIEIHRIKVKEGGYCSKHTHQSKINAFYVLSGVLRVSIWKNYIHEVRKIINPGYDEHQMVDITKVHRDQMCVVPAGEPHMFTALEDTRALEIYWAELNHNDIHRDLIGGINENDSPSLFQNELKKVQTVFN
jgi:quercetin dioxygenase-like cupin family protein